jgi:hypothetical protein
MFKLCQSEITYHVNEDVPTSALDISDDKKIDVLVSLVSSLRSDHVSWIDRTYTVATWSVGILVTAMSYTILQKDELSANEIAYIAIGMTLFGLVTQLFFCAARNAHHGIGAALSRCEASLGLCEPGCYLQNTPFFGYTGKWVPPTHITILQIFHSIVLVISVFMVASINVW